MVKLACKFATIRFIPTGAGGMRRLMTPWKRGAKRIFPTMEARNDHA